MQLSHIFLFSYKWMAIYFMLFYSMQFINQHNDKYNNNGNSNQTEEYLLPSRFHALNECLIP